MSTDPTSTQNQDQDAAIGQRQGHIPMTPVTGVQVPTGGTTEINDSSSGTNPLPKDIDPDEIGETGLNSDDIATGETDDDNAVDNASDHLAELGDKMNANV